MKPIHSLSAGLLLALSLSGQARAEAPYQGVFVYYGSADFTLTGSGLVVGPYPSYSECDAALNAAIDNAVNNQGYQIADIQPCSGHWAIHGGVTEMEAAPYTLEVLAGTSGESGGVAHVLLEEVAAARKTFQIDQYEATLQAIAKAAITDPIRKKDQKDR